MPAILDIITVAQSGEFTEISYFSSVFIRWRPCIYAWWGVRSIDCH